MVCARGHSFDRARSGYVNLLQPQDKRSRNPGDTREAVHARRRFLDRRFGEPLLQSMLTTLDGAVASSVSGRRGEPPAILDAGCGEGYHLAAFETKFRGEAHGLDISTSAIDAAARRYEQCHWIIANADRFLPYADDSFDIVTSITARLNPAEFRRVLRDGGHVLIALPAPDDLIELRREVLGDGALIDRTSRVIDELHDFVLERQERAASEVDLDAAAIGDVMTSSYRGLRISQRQRLEALSTMRVTLSRDLLLFRAP